MNIRDQIAAALSQAFSVDYLGQKVLYNGVEVDAIFTPLTDPSMVRGGAANNNRGGTAATATLQVQVVDVESWGVGDLVSYNDELWKVKREGPGGTWYKHVLQLERDRRMKP